MRFLEGEPFSDFGEEEEFEEEEFEEAGLADYLATVKMEVMQEALENDPVARLYYVRFISRSKGRGREREYPKVVELIGWGRKECFKLKEDGSRGLDRMAEEVLRGIVSPDEALPELIRRVRDLYEYRKIAEGRR